MSPWMGLYCNRGHRGRHCGLQQRGVAALGPCTEVPAPGCDTGDLQPTVCNGSVSTAALCTFQGPQRGCFRSQLLNALGHLKCVMVSSLICPNTSVLLRFFITLFPGKWDYFPEEQIGAWLKGPDTQLTGPNPVSCPVHREASSQTRGHLQAGERRRPMDTGGGKPTSWLLRCATWVAGGRGVDLFF